MRRSPKIDRVEDRRRHKGIVFFWGLLAAVLAGSGSLALASWVVGLAGGSSGEGQAGTVANLTIVASASPAATNELFPGDDGDVVVTIANPNGTPVTVTAVQLPTATTYAAGFSDGAFDDPIGGCSTSTSLVAWNFATGTSGSSHTLVSALTVGANATLVVTFTNDATMGAASPTACQGAYFSLPSLTGVTAAVSSSAATSSPATDAWTS
jgi:hypothetical protein